MWRRCSRAKSDGRVHAITLFESIYLIFLFGIQSSRIPPAFPSTPELRFLPKPRLKGRIAKMALLRGKWIEVVGICGWTARDTTKLSMLCACRAYIAFHNRKRDLQREADWITGSVSSFRSKGLGLKADKLEVMPYENISEGILHQIPCQIVERKEQISVIAKAFRWISSMRSAAERLPKRWQF